LETALASDTGLSLLQALASLVIVIAMMFGFSFIYRYLTGQKMTILQGDKRRITVLETRGIDHRNKLVLIRRDNKEHLIAISANGAPVEIGQATIVNPAVNPAHDNDSFKELENKDAQL
jgi:flagellar biogenesis protein FliO